MFDTGKSRTAEWHTYIAGTKRWFRIHTEPVWDGRGNVSYVTTFGIEITGLKQAEENYRLIAEYVHDVVAVLDGDFDPLYISPSAERLFGYSIEDFADKSIFDSVHAEDRDEILGAARLDLEKGLEGATRKFRVVTKGSEMKWAEINFTYVYDEHGRRDRIILNARDITQRERVQRELEELLARNRHLLKETNHRVKNNLSLISSLVSLRSAASDDVDLSDLQSRIEAVHFAHEELQFVEDKGDINLR